MADLLDPRQRQAAALLLSAIDLPCECGAWARQLKQAASVWPGATIDAEALNSRRAALEKARGLVGAILAGMVGADSPEDPPSLDLAARAALALLDSYGPDDEQDDADFVGVRAGLRRALAEDARGHG